MTSNPPFAAQATYDPNPPTGDASCSACPRGHYCPKASAAPVPCPPGTYGNATGLGDADCDGICARGHYCPAGSFLPTQFPCPAGRYGNATGLTTDACSTACAPEGGAKTSCAVALCEPGFYCPEASTHGRMRECGEGHYCPRGSPAPIPVADGLFGVGGGGATTRSGQATCADCCPEGATACDAPRRDLYLPY